MSHASLVAWTLALKPSPGKRRNRLTTEQRRFSLGSRSGTTRRRRIVDRRSGDDHERRWLKVKPRGWTDAEDRWQRRVSTGA